MQLSSPPRQGRHPSRNQRSRGGAEGSFKRKALSLALFLILTSSALNALFGDRGLLEMLKARRELRNLEQEIAAIESENSGLLEEIRALKTSPLAVERLARERLGLARPGEVIVIVRDPHTR